MLTGLVLIIVYCDSVFRSHDWFVMSDKLKMVDGLAKFLSYSAGFCIWGSNFIVCKELFKFICELWTYLPLKFGLGCYRNPCYRYDAKGNPWCYVFQEKFFFAGLLFSLAAAGTWLQEHYLSFLLINILILIMILRISLGLGAF